MKFLVALLASTFGPSLYAQTASVTAVAGPDESMTETYMSIDRDCRSLVNKRGNPAEAIAACKKVADEADLFAPRSHFITRRAAYVFYTTALIQGRKAQEAVKVGDKAVAVVMLGHDDGSGSSAAFSVRAQAKALAGDLTGSDDDLEKAETYERAALRGPAGQALNAQYTKALKGLLNFHAQVLSAMNKPDAAAIKLEEAKKP